ncbi:MAG TPA: CPBP family glutamic-type intramembrane protease [Candidatus Sulfotelmatobacter sp.]|nr:CPBP family glutamic-type intramembrane protease [Candidatus Sulfotelmatobacter sp.]
MGTPTLEVPVRSEVSPPSVSSDPNSIFQLSERARGDSLGWAGPLILLVGRSVLIIAAQAITACFVWLHSHDWSWNDAAKWWTVYGTLVDIGCLWLMAACTRREGIRLRDLIGRAHLRWGRDLLLGAAFFVLVFPFFILGAASATRIVYGAGQLPSFAGLADARVLPVWAVIYSFSVWWLLWSPTEEMTYRGYAFPRFEVLCRNRAVAIGVVSFWWSLQHVFLPFILDWKLVLWRFLAFLPGVVFLLLPSLKIRRLAPFVFAHWPMDILAVFMTLKL